MSTPRRPRSITVCFPLPRLDVLLTVVGAAGLAGCEPHTTQMDDGPSPRSASAADRWSARLTSIFRCTPTRAFGAVGATTTVPPEAYLYDDPSGIRPGRTRGEPARTSPEPPQQTAADLQIDPTNRARRASDR